MSAWVDIKFAPKDLTKVDLWVVTRGKGHRLTDCWWSQAFDGKGEPVEDNFNGWCQGEYRPSGFNPYPPLIEGTATHYMLPPEPPVR